MCVCLCDAYGIIQNTPTRNCKVQLRTPMYRQTTICSKLKRPSTLLSRCGSTYKDTTYRLIRLLL